ncbi:MAG: hypothetical protein ACRDH8_04810 [Actinomycetota bacterium]
MSRFRDALAGAGLAAIAEIKRRSPSAGDLRPGADAGALAASFERSGAAAISVLLDERFGGRLEDVRVARARTSVPLLAKGFFRREARLDAIRAAGADAVLLILRDLDDDTLARLQARARVLGMDALVEVHDRAELDRAIRLGADPIGVNARDLHTFLVDRRVQLELVAAAPRDRVVVAESGVSTRAHGAAAELAGADAVLVGTVLMRAVDPGAALRDLLARPLVKVCGVTREEDVDAARAAGADLVGFVLADSPRRVAEPLPVPDDVLSVAVFVGQAGETGTDLIQRYDGVNGHRSRDGELRRGGERVAAVVDLPWLGEDPGHLDRASRVPGRVMLAGGLHSGNVRRAVTAVRPWCVDAARGLESAPGIKDHSKVRAFVLAVREPVRP